jgi:hypothetical protein
MISATVGAVRARTAPLRDRAAHDAAEALGQQWFGPSFDETRFDEWARRVEHLLFVAEELHTGEFLGYADQLFLAPATEAALRAGTTSEDEFGTDAIVDDATMLVMPAGSRVTLYLAGMCVTAPRTPQGHEAARALRACRRTLLAQWRARGLVVTMLMAAATEAGRKIATRAGGVLIGPADARVDGYDLFELRELPED